MNKVILIADKDIRNYVGGAELDDACLIDRLDTEVEFKTCAIINKEDIDPDTLYIISNFTSLTNDKIQTVIGQIYIPLGMSGLEAPGVIYTKSQTPDSRH